MPTGARDTCVKKAIIDFTKEDEVIEAFDPYIAGVSNRRIGIVEASAERRDGTTTGVLAAKKLHGQKRHDTPRWLRVPVVLALRHGML